MTLARPSRESARPAVSPTGPAPTMTTGTRKGSERFILIPAGTVARNNAAFYWVVGWIVGGSRAKVMTWMRVRR